MKERTREGTPLRWDGEGEIQDAGEGLGETKKVCGVFLLYLLYSHYIHQFTVLMVA